jgi:two-component system invasion response regulator UvrY
MNILIVDDHSVIHHGLTRMLDDEFKPATFGNAHDFEEALNLVAQKRWDVVILDLDLPGRGGLEVLRQIRLDQPKLPVVIFSMHSEDQFAIRAFKVGASGYVAKDSPSTQLVDAIRKVIHGHKYVSPALAEKMASDLGRKEFPEPHHSLSDREFEVMRMIAVGKTTTAIANDLVLSVKTVSTYRTRVLEKLGLQTTSELIRYTIDHGLDG